MNLAIAATVFPVIFIGELPDKTMFASLFLSTRGRATAVWLGAAAAFAVHVAIAVTVGTVAVLLLPRRPLEAAVALMFLTGAILAIRELRNGRDDDQPGPAPDAAASPARAAVTAFVVIFVAEWGDLTQVLTANLAAHYHSPWSVGTGAVLALWAIAAIAVAGGKWLARVVDVTILRVAIAVVLTGFAAYAGWIALT